MIDGGTAATVPELAAGAIEAESLPAPAVTPPPPQPSSAAQRGAQLMQLAVEHEEAGRLDQAESILRHIMGEAGDHHPALHLMGIVAFKKKRPLEAVQWIERSIALAPMTPLYYRNVCEMYRVLGRHDEALAAGNRAAALAPADPHCHHNLGVLHYHRQELDQAIAAGEAALRLDPQLPGAHFGIAEASLLRGDFARGWDEYEWRFRLAHSPQLLPPTDRPQWDGTPLDAGTLLLIADQGYGDVVQFARYIPWAAARCPRLAVACSRELYPVLEQLAGAGALFDLWERAPEFAAYCPLSGLPRLAGTRLDTIPAETPYLHAEADRRERWAERLAALAPAGSRRIGIAWAGRPTHRNDANRSARLATFAPLAEIANVTLFALQKGPAQAEIGSYWGRAPLFNIGPELRDFGDTLAVIDCLDLVVTVDTAVAHIAGAMGKPVWIILPYAPDWRWLLERADSPWYPSARLFRQSADRGWEPCITEIAAALAGRQPVSPPKRAKRRAS
jgi:Tfp pilus assembly protein PilF